MIRVALRELFVPERHFGVKDSGLLDDPPFQSAVLVLEFLWGQSLDVPRCFHQSDIAMVRIEVHCVDLAHRDI